jgi:hypothetical protein
MCTSTLTRMGMSMGMAMGMGMGIGMGTMRLRGSWRSRSG